MNFELLNDKKRSNFELIYTVYSHNQLDTAPIKLRLVSLNSSLHFATQRINNFC